MATKEDNLSNGVRKRKARSKKSEKGAVAGHDSEPVAKVQKVAELIDELSTYLGQWKERLLKLDPLVQAPAADTHEAAMEPNLSIIPEDLREVLHSVGLKQQDLRRVAEIRERQQKGTLLSGEAEEVQTGINALRDAAGLSGAYLREAIFSVPAPQPPRTWGEVLPQLRTLSEELGIVNSDLVKVLKRGLHLLSPVEAGVVQERAKWLMENARLSPRVLSTVVGKFPGLLRIDVEEMKHRVQCLKDMGIGAKDVGKVILGAPHVLSKPVEELTQRHTMLLEWGLGNHESFVHCPTALTSPRFHPRLAFLHRRKRHLSADSAGVNIAKVLQGTDKVFVESIAQTKLAKYERFKEKLLKKSAPNNDAPVPEDNGMEE